MKAIHNRIAQYCHTIFQNKDTELSEEPNKRQTSILPKITRKYLLPILLSFFFLNSALAQDSLERDKASLNKLQGTEKIDKLLKISEQYRRLSSEEAVHYAQLALDLSKEEKKLSHQAQAELALGHAYYSLNEYELAEKHLLKSIQHYKESKNAKGIASAYNRLGNNFVLQGDYDKALDNFREALSINEELQNNIEIARSYSNLGNVFRILGSYKSALKFALKALQTYQKTNYNEGKAWTLLNIGRLYKEMQDYSNATAKVDGSMFLYTELKDETGQALCNKEFSAIYYAQGYYDLALEYGEQVLQYNQKQGNKHGVANSQLHLGKIYFDLRKFKQAEYYLQASEKGKQKLQDETRMSELRNYLGKLYMNQFKYGASSQQLNKALRLAQNKGLRKEEQEIYLSLSKLAQLQENDSKALLYFKKHTQLKDSIYSKEITRLELQFEFDRKQEKAELEQAQKEAIHKKELENQKTKNNALLIGLGMVIILAIVIYRSYRQKKESNIKLALQNEEIRQQKEEIEAQRDQVVEQRDEISKQKKIITDSIRYASRIQAAMLPQEKQLSKLLGEHFIFFKPKNIVSGDFYWATEKSNKLVLVAADCTGHGVPGAFMSMLGVAFLNEIVNKNEVLEANIILEQLRKYVIESLHQESKTKGPKDGMDMALCIIDKDSMELQFAGANNQMYLIRNSELHEIKADKMPIGIYARKTDNPFTKHTRQLEKGDVIYLFSDGFPDQFGGPNGHKLKYTSFKNLLLELSEKDLNTQKTELDQFLDKWQGGFQQIDDVLVLGVRF